MNYREFLETKIELAKESGFEVEPTKVNSELKPHQKDAVVWELKGGRREEHWYYEDILKFHEKQQARNPKYGYNYGHFTLVDNMSLSDNQIKTILSTYQKDSVWYKRESAVTVLLQKVSYLEDLLKTMNRIYMMMIRIHY